MLDGADGQCHASAALTPVKIRYPLYRMLGGPQGLSGRMRKVSPSIRIRSSDRPAPSEYIDCAAPPPDYVMLTVFPLQQWLHEDASVLRYTYVTYIVI
jgi:hypothetical protein